MLPAKLKRSKALLFPIKVISKKNFHPLSFDSTFPINTFKREKFIQVKVVKNYFIQVKVVRN